MKTKQTTVDWLKNTLEFFGNKHELVISWDDFDKIFEKAKQMEKEQITSAYMICDDSGTLEESELYAEQYYNETYGN